MASHHRTHLSLGLLAALLLGSTALGACATHMVADVAVGAGAPEPVAGGADGKPVVTAVDPGMHPAYVGDPFEEYADHEVPGFGLVLRLPGAWTPLDLDTEWRIEGTTGFVHVRAVDNESGDLGELCSTEAHGSFQPYGSKPTITPVELGGQPGCSILPSGDQMTEGNWSGAVVARYPEPLEFRGSAYRFAVVTVDLPHLQALVDGLAFA